MKKYGFVYLWFDSWRKMYYIGSHWGTENDGYICSSNRMRKAHKRRPNDFKRRILTIITNNRKELLETEHRWLSLIKESELGDRYYNLITHHPGHWTAENNKETIHEKMRNNHWSKNPKLQEKIKLRLSEVGKGRTNLSARKPRTEEEKRNISEKLKGRPINYVRTKETREKISNNSKRLVAEGRIGMKGKNHSEETKAKMSNNNAMNNETHRQKVKAAKQGVRWLKKDKTRKMAVPGTEKYNNLLSNGFLVI